MARQVVAFLALLFSALTLIPYGAHLFAMPNKIDMSKDPYLIAQSVYRGWAMLAVILVPALLINMGLAVVTRREGRAFGFAVAACALTAATFVVFFAFTYPANVATQNWTLAPDNWAALRRQWEYSHAADALLSFAAFCCVALAALGVRR